MSARRIIVNDPAAADLEDQDLEFRLTYKGKLLSDQDRKRVTASRAEHKQTIRKKLHPQLRRLWEVSPYLALQPVVPTRPGTRPLGRPSPQHTAEQLADR